METLLVVVTVVSLAVAVAMSVVAWRLLLRDRRRSEEIDVGQAARLSAPHGDPIESAGHRTPLSGEREGPDWDRRPTLPGRTQPPAGDLALGTDPAPDGEHAPVPSSPPADGGLRGHVWLAVAAGALLVTAAVVTTSALRSPEIAAAFTMTHGSADGAMNAAQPLELRSLHYERTLDGTFAVIGSVRNPTGGARLGPLEVVVYLFDDNGGYLASGLAPLDVNPLRPGSDSSFAVSIPGMGHQRIGRYRVSFRSSDGTAVSHVDRRNTSDADGHGPA